MKYATAMLIMLVLAATAFGQAETSATVEAQTARLGQGDPPASLTTAVPGYDAKLRGEYLAALLPKADVLTGVARGVAYIQLYGDLIGFGKDTVGLTEKITAAIDAASASDKPRLVGVLYGRWYCYRTMALRYVDTPGLAPPAQRVADGLGIYLGRAEPKHLVAAASLAKFTQVALWKAWPLADKVALKRLLAIMPVANHADYVTAVNTWMVKNRTPNLAQTTADYQTYLKDGAGGTNLLDGVTIPADDAIGAAVTAVLASNPDLKTEARVNLLLLQGRNKEAFQLAEAALRGVAGDVDTGNLSVNVHRLAKVIKAIDGHWKRATDYVNLFQPQKEGDAPIHDPIPDLKRELGL
ncbi:MAG: cadherin repeat domain-containing protein [Phycisphaerae bacterium]|nr:cadherin repeat domain-containing protein [Phycisphaerae bacterium]